MSRTVSFIVGLALAGLVAFAALGEDKCVIPTLGDPRAPLAVSSDAGPCAMNGSVAPFAVDLTNPAAPALIQMHDIVVRLDRIETLLREMRGRHD